MNDNGFQIPRLNVIDVARDAFEIYRNESRLLLKLSFMSFLIQLLFSLPNIFENITKDTILILTLKFISAILLLPSIYYQMKLSLAIYVSISERYNERKIDFEKSIAIASEKFWRYLGVNIKYYLIILLPIIGVMAPFYFIKELFFKWTIVIVFGMSGTILASVFGFAPLMVVAENDRKQYFKISKQLAKGDMWRVAILVLVATFVFLAPYQLYMHVFNDYKSILPVKKYIISSINQLFFVFVTPFTSSVYMVMYYKLKRNKRIG